MRIPVLTLILAIATVAPATAQMSYGVKAGVNYADVSFDGDVASSGRVGLLAGGFATIPLFGWLAVQPEVIYTVKGTSVDVADIKSDLIVDYVEVPLLARISIRRKIYVAVGPSMAFRVRARSRTAFGGSTEEIDLKEDVESFDLGVVGAAGIDLGRWVFDGRYTHGLSDIDARDDAKMRNRVLSVSAGIRF
ncbi:MAG: PorT family protein [Acidobacteria bacterium]|nr:PorT family protein [Acidobacteriota bacterium]